MVRKQRLKIGLLVSDINDDHSRNICRGAMEAAKENQAELLVFVGRYLERDYDELPEIKYDYQHNTVFPFANTQKLDVLLIALGTIGYAASMEQKQHFLQQYQGIPIILLAAEVEGYISVKYNNATGIQQAVDYLVEQQHCTKIGMLAGCVDNDDANERLAAYKDALKKHNIEIVEKRIEYGTEQSYAILLQSLHLLKVHSSYLYLYKKPITNLLEDKWQMPNQLLMKAYQQENRVQMLPRNKQLITYDKVIENDYMRKTDGASYVYVDLFSNEQQYGLLVLEMEYDYFQYIEAIMYQMSMAIKMINLLAQQEHTQKELEESMFNLKLNNIELDQLSKLDPLTSLWNRRGFDGEAERAYRIWRNRVSAIAM